MWIEATKENIEKYLSNEIYEEREQKFIDFKNTKFTFLCGCNDIVNSISLICGILYDEDGLTVFSEYCETNVTHFCLKSEFETILPKIKS